MTVQTDIDKLLSDPELGDGVREYLDFHRFRYRHLIDKVKACLGGITSGYPPKMLDVGPHWQTLLMGKAFLDVMIDTIGHRVPWVPPGNDATHFQLNLNSLYEQKNWPDIPPHDIIIVAEVIEHLSISPITVLKFLATSLTKNGVIILQTPNALALIKRWHMLRGKNPFPIIGEYNPDNFPYHIKESSIEDLIFAGHQAGLKIIEWDIVNYFNSDRLKHKFCYAISDLLPKRFRAGITILYQKIEE